MPDGTVQDQRIQPDQPTDPVKWGYLKVKDPRVIGDPCDWNEYILYLDPNRLEPPVKEHCPFEVKIAKLEYLGISRPIHIAVLTDGQSMPPASIKIEAPNVNINIKS